MDYLAALALLGSGVISTAGSLYANKKNIDFQKMVNDINWQIAAQNNATQIEMANSAHQREVRDLRAAGLNPILSAGGSGSPMPSLTTARQDSAQIQNPVEGLANSASSLAHYVSEQYDLQTQQQRQDIVGSRIENEILDNQQQQENLAAIRSKLHEDALVDLGFFRVWDPEAKKWTVHVNPNSEYYKKYKEGLMADAKLAAQKYGQTQYENVIKGVNSAGSLGAAFLFGRKGRGAGKAAGNARKAVNTARPRRRPRKVGPSGNPDNPNFE